MRVAMHTSIGDRCGIAAYSRELIRAFDPAISVDLVPIEPGRHPLEYYGQIADRLNAADLVHIQHEYSFWGGIMPGNGDFSYLRSRLRKPSVITAHTSYTLPGMFRLTHERRPVHRTLKRLLCAWPAYRRAIEEAPFLPGQCIVHTREAAAALVARGAAPDDLHVIAAGIPSALPQSDGGAAFRARHGLGQRRCVALFGFTTPFKGYELAVQALTAMPPDVALVIAGGARVPEEQPYLDALQSSITAMGLSDRVVITGYIPDSQLAGAMACAELVLVPHTRATGSYSVTVPLAHSRAIIASDLACFRDIAADGGGIRLFRSGDASELLAAVLEVLEAPSIRERMERDAGAFAAAHSWRSVAERTVEVYERALSSGASP